MNIDINDDYGFMTITFKKKLLERVKSGYRKEEVERNERHWNF